MLERRDPNITELERRLSGMVVIGKVSQVDHEKARYRVKSGELETDWIPFTSARAGGTRTYDSLDEDEQVIFAAPSGDMSQAVIIGALATQETQAADAGNVHRTVYPDGTVVEYDHEAKAYSMSVADGGAFTLVIGGGASVTGSGDALTLKAGNIKLEGNVEIEGEGLTHNGKNVGDTHKHGGVISGGSLTDVPA